MTEKGYPLHPRTRAIHQWIERQVIKYGTQFIFTTRSARQMYLDRYPELVQSSCIVIPNGYDEDDFADIEARSTRTDALEGCIRLVHAGLIYPDDRDPKSFFRALHKLKRDGVIDARVLKIDLRASGAEQYYASLLRELEIDDIVHLLPALPHRESLRDTAASDGLLLFQAASCNHQIPAKVYEYFRLDKPILALTATAGDTAMLLNEVGGATIVDLNDEDAIARQLAAFLDAVRHGTHSVPDPNRVCMYTRKNATAALARCLDQLIELRTVQNTH
jgi:glycosyltransferase involved in cell wall biosynthesis